jgi:hypothetical protein
MDLSCIVLSTHHAFVRMAVCGGRGDEVKERDRRRMPAGPESPLCICFSVHYARDLEQSIIKGHAK